MAAIAFLGLPLTSWIRAMWTAISSPLIHSLFKSTWFGDFRYREVNLFG
jgi:hypothetical protein